MATKVKGSSSLDGSHESANLTPEESAAFEEMTDGMKINVQGSLKDAPDGASNKMNTSSSAGKTGRQAKGDGAPYATDNNFEPAQSGGNDAGSGSAGDTSGAASPPPTTTPDASGNTQPSATTPLAPGRTAGGGYENSVEGDLKRMEDQQAAQQLADYDDKVPTKDLREAENEDAEKKKSRRQKRNDAKSAEEAAAIPGLDLRKAENSGLLNKKGGKQKNLKNKLLQYAKKKKWKLIAGGVGIGGAFFLLMLLLFLLGTLLIPHFVSNVVGWQFVKVTRAAYESTQEVLEEQMGYQAESAADKAATKAKYDADPNDTAAQEEEDLTPDKMNKAADNLDHSTALKENAANGQLKSVTYEDQGANTTTTTDVNGSFSNGEIQAPTAMNNPATAEGIVTDETKELDTFNPYQAAGPVYQKVTPTVLEDEAGEPPSGLDPDDYPENDSTKVADEKITTDVFDKENDITAQTSSTDSNVNKDAQAVDDMETADMANPAEVEQIVADDGNLPTNLINLINSDFVQSALDSVASKIGDFLNPATGKLIPFCIVDQGSKFSGPTAQAQSSEVQRSFILTAAVADQQKRGSPYVTSTMVGAMNWKLEGDSRAGGVTRSIPIERASGEKVTTTSQISTEGSPLGNLQNSGNILAALGVPFSGTLQSALDAICPAITNIWVNLGLGVANLTFLVLSAIFTGGTGDAVEAAADGGAEEAADVVTESIVSRLLADFSSKVTSSGFDILKDFGKNVIVGGGLVAGATFAAKFYVMAQAGTIYSGLSTGPQFDNGVDQGGNQISNATVANAYGGRPLTNTEAMEVQQDDNKTLADFNASQSAYQRYLAISNPQSLASVLTDRIATNLNYGFFSSILADMGNIFNPASLMPQVLFGGVSGQANAAANVDTQDYGDVQQGWTDTEYSLIAANPSYKSPSENQYILDQSGDASTIDQTYGPCFDDSVATLLSLQTNGTPDIVRDGNGDVNQTEGLCSPQNLGPNNPQYGDLVFRYRLARSYGTSLDIIEGVANAT